MKKSYKGMMAGVALLSTITFSATAFAGTVTMNSDGPNTGKSALEIFKQYFGPSPVDGPTDSVHIRETTSASVGNVFNFHLNDSGDYDGDNTDRQRVELKGYDKSPDNVVAKQNETVTYKWLFRVMNDFGQSSFCHIFQIKAKNGTEEADPILTFTLDGNNLVFRHSPNGPLTTLAQTPKSNIVGKWVEATVKFKASDSGSLSMTLKDVSSGNTLMSYSGTKDMWRSGADIVRPKWGIYRKITTGMPTADIQFANFQIIK
ncbi:heparin lyase I family protein [Paenibacillus whitsoniae]|nr:heparin lyase I family protein [Paenibacillus whitsoniae]